MISELERTIGKKLSKAGDAVEDLSEYASRKGDVMLELVLEQNTPNSTAIVLKQREKPIYTDSNGAVDIVEYSGIEVPKHQIVAEVENDDNDQFLVAVAELISVIRQYEDQRVKYEKAYDGFGIDRQAQVSVTHMDRLNKLKEGLEMPKTYHSVDHATELVVVKGFESGCVAYLPRIRPIIDDLTDELVEESS